MKCTPQHVVCVCLYSAKFKLYIAALDCACGRHVDIATQESMCSPPSNQCLLGNCGNCLNDRHFTLERLGITEGAEILVGTYDSDDLMKKKAFDFLAFPKELHKNFTRTARTIRSGEFMANPYTRKSGAKTI